VKADSMQVGDLIDGKYELVALIGEGGMGVVYEARHVRIGRRVALKFLHPRFRERPELVARLIREAQAATAIGSEHIVDITDVGETDEVVPYLVMEYLAGNDLAQVLEQEGRIEPTRAILWVLQVCRALSAAHQQGIVHRDLKPDNLFLTCREDGTEWIKIVDFGIAKFRDALTHDDAYAPRLTATGATMGTPYYMSPEQARGARELDHRADVYSVGVILFELLSGVPPFEGQNFNELIINIATGEPRLLKELCPDVDEGLGAAIRRAMHRDQEYRFPDIVAFADAIAPFADLGDVVRLNPRSGAYRRAEMALAANASMRSATPSGSVAAVSSRASSGNSPAAPIPEMPRPADAMADTMLGWAQNVGAGAQDKEQPSAPGSKTPDRLSNSDPNISVPTALAIPGAAIIEGARVSTPVAPGRDSTLDRSIEVVVRRRSKGFWAVVVAVAVVLPTLAVGAVMLAGGESDEGRPRGPSSTAATVSPAPVPEPAPESLNSGAAASGQGGDQATEGTVLFEVNVQPASAVILLDGIPLESNPFRGRFPRDGARHRLEARAEGHASKARFVVFDEDRSLQITLDESTSVVEPTKATPSRDRRRRDEVKRSGSVKRHRGSWQIDRSNPYGGGP
jgi:serine/threonine-protein kinase